MPEQFQTPVVHNMNQNSPKYRAQPSAKASMRRNDANQRKELTTDQQRMRPVKTPEKAHLDTVRRRERRQKHRVPPPEESGVLGRLNDNRFVLLTDSKGEDTDSVLSEADEETPAMNDQTRQETLSRQGKQTNDTKRKNGVASKKQPATTIEVPKRREQIDHVKKRMRGNNQHQGSLFQFETDAEFIVPGANRMNNEQSSLHRDKPRIKTYLQGFKIQSYLKQRMNTDKRVKLDIKEAFSEVCAYAKSTIEAYDEWVLNHYEDQVWKHFYKLGRKRDHWAKEVVNVTHTRETKTNMAACEKKIAQFTSACFDANSIIARGMRDIATTPGLSHDPVIVERAHDLILDYIKEATQGASKMSLNRIRRASIEEDEWKALQAFESVASEQQRSYARAFCKPALKCFQKKKRNFDMVSAHISQNVIPKILPQYDFQLPMDENSLSSEEARENKESIQKLSRDFRLKATELYLKLTRDEFAFQEERFDNLMDAFPQDRNDQSAGLVDTAEVEMGSPDERGMDDGVFTQKPLPLPQEPSETGTQKGLELFRKYTDIAQKRGLLETEREILFLAESGVEETPFTIQQAQELNPVLRLDFVLQA